MCGVLSFSFCLISGDVWAVGVGAALLFGSHLVHRNNLHTLIVNPETPVMSCARITRDTGNSVDTRSSIGSSCGSASHIEPLLDPIAASDASSSTSAPLLYSAIICEGALRVEATVPSLPPTATVTLRTAAFRTESSLQRAVSFVSKDEKIPRRSFLSSSALPAAVTVHVLRRHGHAFVVVTRKSFEEIFANRFLEEVCAAFAAAATDLALNDGGDTSTSQPSTARSGSFFSWRRAARREDTAESLASFRGRLEMLLVNHGRPERLARLRRIRSVENATDEVASVMEEALDQLLATGQNLDALEDKSEQLLAQATAFQRKSRGIRFRFCCRNLKLTCCIGSLVSLVIALVTLLVLQYTGVIHLWPTGGGAPSPPGPG